MDNSQVTAALGLLKKCLPDLMAAEFTGKGGERLFHRVERVILK